MRRRAARVGIDFSSLTLLDRLAAVGMRGMGALVYQPDYSDGDVGTIDSDALATAANAVLEGRDTDIIAHGALARDHRSGRGAVASFRFY